MKKEVVTIRVTEATGTNIARGCGKRASCTSTKLDAAKALAEKIFKTVHSVKPLRANGAASAFFEITGEGRKA